MAGGVLPAAVLVAVREWAKLSGIETRAGFVAYAVLMAAVVAGLWLAPEGWRHGFLHVVVVFWLAAIFVVWKYPASGRLFTSVPCMAATGVLVIPGAWLAWLNWRFWAAVRLSSGSWPWLRRRMWRPTSSAGDSDG